MTPVLSGGFVVGAGGVDFIFEIAEVLLFAINPNGGAKLAPALVIKNTLVFRCGTVKAAAVVQGVLSAGDVAQVVFAIVKAVEVDVVNDFVAGSLHNDAVHTDEAGKAVEIGGTNGVISIAVVEGIPFITNEFAKIVEIDAGVLALRELDSHKGMIILSLSIVKQRSKYYSHKDDGNWDKKWYF